MKPQVIQGSDKYVGMPSYLFIRKSNQFNKPSPLNLTARTAPCLHENSVTIRVGKFDICHYHWEIYGFSSEKHENVVKSDRWEVRAYQDEILIHRETRKYFNSSPI